MKIIKKSLIILAIFFWGGLSATLIIQRNVPGGEANLGAGLFCAIVASLHFRLLLKNKKNVNPEDNNYQKKEFLNVFKNNKYKNELEELRKKYETLEASLTPEMQDARQLESLIEELKKRQSHIENEIANRQKTISELDNEILNRKEKIVWMDDEILVQEFGLYQPQYDFASALDYKEKLAQIRTRQKELIKQKLAVIGNTDWQVNGSKAQGKKMVNETQKLLLRAFNNECDDLISRVKYTNFDASLDKIYKSAETISKLGTVMGISINQKYLNLKVKELRLAFEYAQKKQEEKEEQKAARAEQREQARIQKELDEQRKKIEKEQTHYQTAFERIKLQIEQNPNNADLLKKKEQLEEHLSDINKALTDIDYRQANMRAGYVYIISNIGAFGENIYKIGMTRRLDPQDRVDELGDASVPFNFDVHAMIFSDDAPALESALHKAFEDRKLNMVNQRREFFNVTLDEIKEVVKKNFDKTVEFIDTPNAEQYRVSLKMKESQKKHD